MAVEDTDLERRVLAHEKILQALITNLIDERPELLGSLCAQFSAPGCGGYQHDHTATAEYAEQFMHEVSRGRFPQSRPHPELVKGVVAPAATDLEPTGDPVTTIRSQRRSGIWQVTRDRLFHGDYTQPGPAMDAAVAVAREVQRKGGVAQILFDQEGRRP